MSSIITLVIVLLVIAIFCLVFIIVHYNAKQRSADSLEQRLKKAAQEFNLNLSLTDTFNDTVFGFDKGDNKLLVCKPGAEQLVDLSSLRHCRKEKKWIHFPAENGHRAETHLEKIFLQFSFNGERPTQELVFYEYRHNSIFEMHGLEQKADYWELVFNKKIV